MRDLPWIRGLGSRRQATAYPKPRQVTIDLTVDMQDEALTTVQSTQRKLEPQITASDVHMGRIHSR